MCRPINLWDPIHSNGLYPANPAPKNFVVVSSRFTVFVNNSEKKQTSPDLHRSEILKVEYFVGLWILFEHELEI